MRSNRNLPTCICVSVPRALEVRDIVSQTAGRRALLCFALLALGAAPAYAAYPNGYSNCKVVTTQHAMVSGAADLTNYPLAVILTDADLKTTANGGLVNNSSGYDIAFYPDCTGLGAASKWELESYSPATGAIVAHVLRPTLSRSADDTIGMFYGGAFSSFQSTASAVWAADGHYGGVWHFPDGTALTTKDSTSNANHGSTVGTVTAGAAKVGGGASLSSAGNGNLITVPSSASVSPTTAITLSAWISTLNSNNGNIVTKHDDGYYLGVGTRTADSGKAALFLSPLNSQWLEGSTNIADGNFHYVVGTYDGSLERIYVDGVQQGSNSLSGSIATGIHDLDIGSRRDASEAPGYTNPFNGTIDEVRISNIARSPDWILTEFRNQNTPATYISLGPRVTNNTRVKHSAKTDG